MQSSPESDSRPSTGHPRSRVGSSRNRWTLIVFIPTAFIAVVCFGLAGWHAWATGSTKWDDFLIVGIGWLIAAAASAMLLRLIWAVIAPERLLPRWLALLLCALSMIAALFMLLVYWMASAWGP